MAQQMLTGGPARRRVLGGLLDADGWTWASIKALFWLIVIIMTLGYIPDRAYYFTVFETIDLGINPATFPGDRFTPISLCPAPNKDLPCPAPAGAAIPWDPAPAELSLPAPRTDGAVVQVGARFLYVGGNDGAAASSAVYVAELAGSGNYGAWAEGPPLPEARTDAGAAFLAGKAYVVGGAGPDGAPRTTTYVLSPDPATGALGTWAPDEALALPAPRRGGTLVAAADGLIYVGGADESGPTATVWKANLDSKGKLSAWKPQADLAAARVDANAAIIGDFLWVYGGSDAAGPTAQVQIGRIVKEAVTDPSVTPPTRIDVFGTQPETSPLHLPEPRTNAAGFTANGALYLIGGSDGTGGRGELYWTIPDPESATLTVDDSTGTGWHHLAQSDLPTGGLAGGAAIVNGPNAFIIGGTGGGGVIASAARTNLAPKAPFFQVSLLGGVTIPALKIEGEIGQQLGYLAAAGVASANFAVLVFIAWAYAHPDRARALWRRIRRRPA